MDSFVQNAVQPAKSACGSLINEEDQKGGTSNASWSD